MPFLLCPFSAFRTCEQRVQSGAVFSMDAVRAYPGMKNPQRSQRFINHSNLILNPMFASRRKPAAKYSFFAMLFRRSGSLRHALLSTERPWHILSARGAIFRKPAITYSYLACAPSSITFCSLCGWRFFRGSKAVGRLWTLCRRSATEARSGLDP